jgi:hypothetical protein
MQTIHPIFGIPVGLCILLLVLFRMFKSNDSTNPPANSSSAPGSAGIPFSPFKRPPKIKTSDYGAHKFDSHGFCTKCGWERDFLIRMERMACKEKTSKK